MREAHAALTEANLTHQPGRVHIAALDGLRGVAALSVMLYHAFVGNSHGWMAVDFFFCLSGFVLALAYERKLAAELRYWRYMSWRVMRIYPMLFIGGVLGLILWRSGESAPALAATSGGTFALVYLAHVLLVPFVTGRKAFPVNNVQWSIFYELVANAAHALLLPILTLRTLIVIVLASGLLLMVRAFQVHTLNLGFELASVDIGLTRMVFSFFLGVLLFRVRDRVTPRLPRISFWWLAAVLLVLSSIHSIERPFAWLEPLRQVITIELVNPSLILLGLVCIAPGRLIRWLGVLSFPLYAIHGPLIFFAMAKLHPTLAGVLLKAAMLGVCVPIAAASVLLGLYVDIPLNRLRRRVFE